MSATNPLPKSKPNSGAIIIVAATESEFPLAMAREITGPKFANALVESLVAKKMTGADLDLTETRHALTEACDRIKGGNLGDVESMLYSQASVLNLMFAEMTRRALRNIYDGETFEAGKAYMSIGLKAQSQSRATLETLGNIKNPPTVFAKQANINNGGHQQVNNDAASRAPATENQDPPSKVLEQGHEQRMDAGTESKAGRDDSQLATVAAGNRAENT